MKFYLSFVNVVVFTVFSTCFHGTDVSGNGNDVAYQFLTYFNNVRTRENLNPLTWNQTLAEEAQTSSDRCRWQLDLVFSRRKTAYMGMSNRTSYPANAMKSWLREKSFTRNGDVSVCCNIDEIHCCGYAMVMNNKVTSLGCGSSYCQDANWAYAEFPDLYIHVCMFYP